jgi:sugar phosphate isomerase/epimerase
MPQYAFTNMAEIFKWYWLNVALDIANVEEEVFELQLMKKLATIIPYIPIIYISDKDKTWKWHLPLGEWNMKIPTFFRKTRQLWFDGPFSVKLNISKKDLADIEKVKLLLKKCKVYYLENYVNITL